VPGGGRRLAAVRPLVLVTGFGPFPRVAENPSGAVARRLDGEAVGGLEVRGVELPVSYARAPAALAAVLAELAPRVPRVLLGLGVQRGGFLRLERRARGVLGSARPDVDGALAAELAPAGPERATRLELEPLRAALAAAAPCEARVSDDAGGYVCEAVYGRLLERAEALGTEALFLHVPPATAVAPEAWIGAVRVLLERLGAGD